MTSKAVLPEADIALHVSEILRALGEDPSREGLEKTPQRVQKSLRHLTRGYAQDPYEILRSASFEASDYDEMVIVKDIELFSMCEHHLLPFFGKCHVAYLPDKRVLGLSKIPRVVEVFARRLQIQEKLTTQIAKVIERAVKPKGVGVVVEAFHLCVMMRGVEKQNAHMITSSMQGRFRTDPKTREEFLDLIRRPKPL
jgi:GTP cyclohydrolase I